MISDTVTAVLPLQYFLYSNQRNPTYYKQSDHKYITLHTVTDFISSFHLENAFQSPEVHAKTWSHMTSSQASSTAEFIGNSSN